LIQTGAEATWGAINIGVSMPVRAFLDSDAVEVGRDEDDNKFQCPSGHFLIQTVEGCGFRSCHFWFQCPSGHFLIQTLHCAKATTTTTIISFNARQGIS